MFVNIATSAGAELISRNTGNSIYRKIEAAYSKALKKWSNNSGIINREQIWTQKRLDELVLLMTDPMKEFDVDKNTLDLLRLFRSELLTDAETWHYLENEFLKISLQDVKHAVLSIQQDIVALRIDPIELKNKLIE